ncbi:MAG: hypothetical protein Q8P89_00845 [bacterium]|nr:hypothetical protein [bacterium]
MDTPTNPPVTQPVKLLSTSGPSKLAGPQPVQSPPGSNSTKTVEGPAIPVTVERVKPPSASGSTKTGAFKTILLIIITIAALGAAGFFGYQNYQIKQELAARPSLAETPQSTPTTTPKPTPTPASEWKEAKFGSLLSYDYPQNWHVAEIWPQTAGQGITLAMDPNPISTAPRGGPLATFEIRVLNGLPNPNEVFEQEKAKFNQENYSDITTEIINSPLGPVYYYKGKFLPGMFEGQPIENYYLTFQGVLNDPPNQQILIVSMALKGDPKLSEMLRHVVLSIKKISN